MVKIEFAKDYSAFFEEFGMSCFEDFFDYSDGEKVNENKKRNVFMFALGEGENRREFFMKRFHDPHFKDILFTFSNFGRICSQAACEWQDANILLANGIETYRPVCYGEETRFGLEKRSFFITEKLGSRCLTDFVGEEWSKLETDEKVRIMAAIGKFVRKIHDARISMPDLYVWHLFVSVEAGGYEFAIIDLHRMRINCRGNSEKIRNLGAFDYSMLQEYFDDGLREAFLDAYMGSDFKGNRVSFCRRVKSRSAVLAGRRHKPKY